MTDPERPNRGCSYWLVGFLNPKTLFVSLLVLGPIGAITAGMLDKRYNGGEHLPAAALVGLACGVALSVVWCWPRERIDISPVNDREPRA